ncbi:MAG TPA: 1,4-dihydroxy-2-naphthoate octaprenyltransferase [Chlamydiales bacterium]|nr:1,4-dihydroxy-2-naphthoate octaprenyltransferase [Chlamydiales bacterium]
MKNESQTSLVSPNELEKWILASRPKTWIASLSPVLIGTSMAPSISWFIFALTALFSLLIQIGTNYANDYFDFLSGADTHERIGPKRAVQQGWIRPDTMKKATIIVFAAAFIVAIPLMFIAGIWSLIITAFAITFGILYTGGPKPLGYLGLGEILVFVFFGPIACCGSFFLQTHTVNTAVLFASIAPGLFSCALLIANNLRDEITDRKANKKTLVVRFGQIFGKIEFALSTFIPLLIPLTLLFFYGGPINLIGVFFLLPIAINLLKQENLLLGTSLLFFFYTLLFTISYLI